MGIFSAFKSKESSVFPWINLTSSTQLKEAIENSSQLPIILFKHSTRCSISSMAKSRFESNWNLDTKEVAIYYLDLIANRDISNEIAALTGVEHQSPQAIVLKNKEVIYQATHSSIDAVEIDKILHQ